MDIYLCFKQICEAVGFIIVFQLVIHTSKVVISTTSLTDNIKYKCIMSSPRTSISFYLKTALSFSLLLLNYYSISCPITLANKCLMSHWNNVFILIYIYPGVWFLQPLICASWASSTTRCTWKIEIKGYCGNVIVLESSNTILKKECSSTYIYTCIHWFFLQNYLIILNFRTIQGKHTGRPPSATKI